MMLRQTFYIAKDLSQELKRLAYENNTKISTLVNDALKNYLQLFRKKKPKTHSLLRYAGKIKPLNGVDALSFQKKARAEWDK